MDCKTTGCQTATPKSLACILKFMTESGREVTAVLPIGFSLYGPVADSSPPDAKSHIWSLALWSSWQWGGRGGFKGRGGGGGGGKSGNGSPGCLFFPASDMSLKTQGVISGGQREIPNKVTDCSPMRTRCQFKAGEAIQLWGRD